MKIINAIPKFGPDLSEEQVKNFLSSKLILQIATLDSKGDPCIHPVWYLFENEKLYVATSKKSKKVQNVMENNLVYYSIDDENVPYIGVKGKATVRLIEDVDSNLETAEKIILKYMGSLDNDLGRHIITQIKDGTEIIMELTPRFYSAWSFSNLL